MADDRPDAKTTLPPPAADAATSKRPRPERLRSGTRVGNYTVRRAIGEGGMGATVYEAIQNSTERLVALKVLPLELGPDVIQRFRIEVRVSALVKHHNIVIVHDADTDPVAGVSYLVMELVAGARTLDAYVHDHPALTLRDRVALMVEICRAAHEAHRLGLVHRDLKPGNVLVDADGVPKIIDFGIATAVNSEVFNAPLPTVASTPSGTPGYMSPEQALGSAGTIDARSDVFALGVILFELLTGQRFRTFAGPDGNADRRAWADVVRTTPATPPSRWDRRLRGDLDRVVLRALAREPARRFADAGALGQALRDVLDDASPFREAEPLPTRMARTFRGGCRSFPRVAALAVIALSFLIGFFVSYSSLFETLGFARFEPALVRAADLTSALTEPMRSVTMVTMDDATFGDEQIVQAMKHWNITPADPKALGSMRRLQAKLIDQLGACDVRAIAMDFGFKGESEGDATLAAAAKALNGRAVPIPVLTVAIAWNESRYVAPALRDAFRFGGANAQRGGATWAFHLAEEIQPGDAVPSLALATCLAVRSPTTRWDTAINADDTVVVRGFDRADGFDGQGRPRETAREPLVFVPTEVRRPGDTVKPPVANASARVRIAIPSDQVLNRSTVAYADVVGPNADLRWLRHRLANQIIIVGDLRHGIGDPREEDADGRDLPAFYGNAVALATLSGALRTDALAVDWRGFVLAMVAVALLGIGLARASVFGPARNRFARLVKIGLSWVPIACFSAGIAWLSAGQFGWLINPGPLLVAGIAAFFLYAAARHFARSPLT